MKRPRFPPDTILLLFTAPWKKCTQTGIQDWGKKVAKPKTAFLFKSNTKKQVVSRRIIMPHCEYPPTDVKFFSFV